MVEEPGTASVICKNWNIIESRELNIRLISAAKDGTADEVKALVAQGANVSATIDVQVLVSRGIVDDSIMDVVEGATAAHFAALGGHVMALVALLEAGAAVDHLKKNGSTAAFLAAWKGHEEALDVLLKAGSDIDHVRPDGCTLAFLAAQEGHLGVLNQLIAAGASVNTPDSAGVTPVYMASQRQDAHTLRRLISAGADIHATNCDGFAPMHVAAEVGNVEAICVLINAGADPDTRCLLEKSTPLVCAAACERREAVAALLGAGANPACAWKGRTAEEWLGKLPEPDVRGICWTIRRHKLFPLRHQAAVMAILIIAESSDSLQRLTTFLWLYVLRWLNGTWFEPLSVGPSKGTSPRLAGICAPIPPCVQQPPLAGEVVEDVRRGEAATAVLERSGR